MDNIYTLDTLKNKERNIYNNLIKILQLKNISIDEDILVEYIQNKMLKNIYITIEILNDIIKSCVDIQLQKEELQKEELQKKLEMEQQMAEDSDNEEESSLEENIQQGEVVNMESELLRLDENKKDFIDLDREKDLVNVNSIDKIPEFVEVPPLIEHASLDTVKTKVLESITNNENSDVPKPILREDYIYIRGVSGDKYKYTRNYLLKKKYNNVESIELIRGYISDTPVSKTIEKPISDSISRLLVSELSVSGQGILSESDEIVGSIGPVPFIWIEIEEPQTKTYSHYTNTTTTTSTGSCNDCDQLQSYCEKCNKIGKSFESVEPYGTFLVKLEQYNFLDHYFKAGAINTSPNKLIGAKNIVYLIDQPAKYIKKFNNLISMDKLKINIRNIGENHYGDVITVVLNVMI